MLQTKVIDKVKEQERLLLSMRENIERRGNNPNESPTIRYETAKMIGMLDILDVLKIDRSEFNWIF